MKFTNNITIILVNNNKARYLSFNEGKLTDGYCYIQDIRKHVRGPYFSNKPLIIEGQYIHYDTKSLIKKFMKIYKKEELLYICPSSIMIEMLDNIKDVTPSTNDFYNNIFIRSNALIYLNKFTYEDKLIYPNINFNNPTRRVTINYDGKNLSALNKDDRKIYMSHPDYEYLTIDYVSHHLSILAVVLGRKVIDFHDYVARHLGTTREEAKIINFKAIYGFEADRHMEAVPLYHDIVMFRNKLFNDFKLNKFIMTPLSNQKYYFKPDINEGTLLSYFVQIYEAEKIALLIVNIKEQLPELDISYLIYDSITIRYKKDTDYDSKLLHELITENKYNVIYE